MTKRSEAKVRGVVPMRDTVEVAAGYVADITDCQPTQVTALKSTDEGGWFVEVEAVADRRFPSSADMLELYEIELDADGEVLGHQRIDRYMRYQHLSPMGMRSRR
jgi:Gas vesicle synthesis protein GvpO